MSLINTMRPADHKQEILLRLRQVAPTSQSILTMEALSPEKTNG